MSLNESSGESESRTRDSMRDTFRTTPSQPIPIPFPYPFQSPCFPFFHSLSHFHCRLAFLVYKFLWPKNACLMAGIVRVCVCVWVWALSTCGWGFPELSFSPLIRRFPTLSSIYYASKIFAFFAGWSFGIRCLLQMPF